MSSLDRDAVLKLLRATRDAGQPIIGGGAGTGISGKALASNGADFIVVYNSGRFRMAGHGSLAGLMPYGDANAIMLEMVEEVKAVVGDTPVVAGICGTDPLRSMERVLDQASALGVAGVQNFPTVGLIDGNFRASLEETGMSYDREVEMIHLAHCRGLLTAPYVFDATQARRMAQAGADMIVVHFGLTTGGSVGANTSITLEETITIFNECAAAAHGVNPDVLVLCHGGPVAMPPDAEFVLQTAKGCDGFLGASSMERLPTEIAIARQVRDFKSISFVQDTKKRGRL